MSNQPWLPTKEQVDKFLRGLEALTAETGIYIDGCGCCGSPSFNKYDLETPPRYKCDENGDNIGIDR
jgi:hypothetical protein